MSRLMFFKTRVYACIILMLSSLTTQALLADEVVWACSRAEPEPEIFDRLRPFRVENLSAKDKGGIVIAISDLYDAYAGQTIRMGNYVLSVCTLTASNPLQKNAMETLGYSVQDFEEALNKPNNKLVLVPSINRMQKCIVENHPAVGFFENVVEKERIGPCF